jgi:hypothetical protein
MKLNVWAFALTCALIWGFGLLAITWWIMLFAGDVVPKTTLSRVYLGYTITPLGSVFGFLWAFGDGLVGGAIFAWLYNVLATKFGVKPA